MRERVRADVQFSYDAKRGKFLEQRYLIGGTASCYGIAFEYRRYLVFVPEETDAVGGGERPHAFVGAHVEVGMIARRWEIGDRPFFSTVNGVTSLG